jgi:hypothetical protein
MLEKKNYRIPAATLVLSFLASCSSQESSPKSPSTSSFESLQPSDLEGTWISSCIPDSSSQTGEKTTRTYRGSNVSIETALFEDTTCRVQYAFVSTIGSYKLGKKITSLDSTYTVDNTMATRTMTAVNASGVATFNHFNQFGFSNWVINVPKDIKGIAKDGKKRDDYQEITYTVVQVKGTSMRVGTAGKKDTPSGNSPETRNTVLDTIVFTKQRSDK